MATVGDMTWLHDNWVEIIESFTAPAKKHPPRTSLWFGNIAAHYNEDGRYYHTLVHIHKMLESLWWIALREPSMGLGTDLRKIELAVYMHDVIYDTTRSDNEEASADFAEKCLRDLGFPKTFADEVCQLIMITKHNIAPITRNEKAIVDADLAGLGADMPTYIQVAHKVRAEFSHVSAADWVKGRAELFLKPFLAKEKIFHTQAMAHKEPIARANLEWELQDLQTWVV